jgi:outer membrane protein insertion porin family
MVGDKYMRRKLAAIFVSLFVCVGFVFAQDSDDGEWFWNQPITKVDFDGLKNVKKSELTGVVSSYIGQGFTDEIYNEMLDKLYALDLFEEIEPYAKHASKSNNDVLLVFKVSERPIIKSVTFVGNRKIRNGELREQIKIKASDVYVESKVLVDERTIRNYYIQKGYTTSKVSHTVEESENGVIVTYKIEEGASTVIRNINFAGNTIASERKLKSKLSLKEAGAFKDGAFQQAALEQDKQALMNFYKERGYVDMSVLDVQIEEAFNEKKQRNELSILFYLQEGSQYTYTGLRLNGNEVFSYDELVKMPKLKPGATYNEVKFQEILSGITGKYYENGYMSNQFYPVPSKDAEPHEISYDVTIVEGPRAHIENVIIKGNSKTKDFVIRREIPIEPGDIFSRDKIISGLRNLMNLQYFSSVVPEPQQGSEQDLVDLVFSVEEQSTTSLQFGMTFSGSSDPDNPIPISLFVKVENSNLFGEGKTISAGTTVSTSEQSVDLGYSQSWIGSLPISFSESLSFSRKNAYVLTNQWLPGGDLTQRYYYTKYEGYAISLSTAFGRRWAYDYAILSLGTGLTNSVTNYIFDENIYVPIDQGLSKYANRWGILNGVWISGSVDNRDINYDPTKGWFASQKYTWYGLIPELEKEFFLRSDTKLEGYLKLLDWHVAENWSLKLVLAAYTGFTVLFPVNNDMVSDSNKVYIDGMFNGRGWTEAYKVAKGQAMLSNRLELRMPIVPNIIGVDFFYDAAAVKNSMNDMQNLSIDDFYFSYGPGIRFLLPQFPLHLLFAWKYKLNSDWQPVKASDWARNNDSTRSSFTDFQFVLSFNITNN